RSLKDRENIIAVHNHTRNAVAGSASSHIAQRMRRGGGSLCGPPVVFAHVISGQLPGRGDVEPPVERTRIRCPLSEERDGHSPLSIHLRGKTRPGDDGQPARDNSIRPEHTDLEVRDMHRSALALAVAGLPTVQLGHHAVQIGALRDAMAMAAMRRDDAVGAGERAAHADRNRLLADIAMHDAVDLAADIVGRGALLEMADRQHLPQYLALLVGGEVRWTALS